LDGVWGMASLSETLMMMWVSAGTRLLRSGSRREATVSCAGRSRRVSGAVRRLGSERGNSVDQCGLYAGRKIWSRKEARRGSRRSSANYTHMPPPATCGSLRQGVTAAGTGTAPTLIGAETERPRVSTTLTGPDRG